ncbi:OLC1v1015963C3 [Oldenlandia corymbosa var. corymbosa]|uniref:OLC1v1015963C3 n=2 Tax=Oldenlandia corymbosa var. corymbosa TaxID=529605 RepID=A0AAV1E6H3_OLDCO|nr:OLC1v1015963C3 [Oldenlandia corymbosa var. corymbosa]
MTMGFGFSASIIGFLCCMVSMVAESSSASVSFISALGDPGMKNPNVRFGFEAWNFCNEVGSEAPNMGSPRLADCADIQCSGSSAPPDKQGGLMVDNGSKCEVRQNVLESDNKLKAGDPFPSEGFNPSSDPNLYAVQKELYLGSLCEVHDSAKPWYFWMIMLKNGNFDPNTTLCPENGRKVGRIVTTRHFPCFGEGCMNQPLVYHNSSRVISLGDKISLVGGFYGTYDLDADLSKGVGANSFFATTWQKNLNSGSWIVSNKLTTSTKYPWLMLYLRADAAEGFNGGYHYPGHGMMKKLPESPNFKVRLTLEVKQGGGDNSQFYLLDIGSCWKNNGAPCDGDTITDVTRYSEMIINPATTSWCRPDNLVSCPPYHISPTGEVIYRNDTSRFPYSAYHLYCAPGNAEHLEKPYDICDPYSNPQAQELVQILPHPEWGVHGYPSNKGDGWIGDPRTWELDVGSLSSRLYFYQVLCNLPLLTIQILQLRRIQ